MKKFNLILISMLMLVLSGFLGACTFKETKAYFTQNEIVFNADQEPFDLDNFLRVENASKRDIDYVFSNSDLFALDGSKVRAKEGKSGRGFVYATYNGNKLASMDLIVRRPFDAPKDVVWSDEGFVTWDAVTGIFDGEDTETTAEKFRVTGERALRDENGAIIKSEPIENAGDVVGRRFDIPKSENGEMIKGEYHLQVQALQQGYFSNGAITQKTIYVGFMPQLQKDDFSFDGKKLSWNWDVLNPAAKFRVKLDNVWIGESFENMTEYDFSSVLQMASAGEHRVTVSAFDVAETEDKKLMRESEEIVITKLYAPQANYSFDDRLGGQIEITYDPKKLSTAQQFEIFVTNEAGLKTNAPYVVQNLPSNKVTTSLNAYDRFSALASGIYSVEVQANSQSTKNEFFFESDLVALDKKIFKLPQVTLSGVGGNVAGENTFHAQAEASSAQVRTKFLVSNVNTVVEEGFDLQQTEKTFTFDILESGVLNYSIAQLPATRTNWVNEQNVYVLNSDFGEGVEIAKLPQIEGEILHEYQGEKGQEKSVLTFKKLKIQSEKIISYSLKVKNQEGSFEKVEIYDGRNNGQVEKIEIGEDVVSIRLTDSIEKLFEPTDGEYVFEIETETDEPRYSIGSLTERPFLVLNAPQKEDNNFLEGFPYLWQKTTGAKEYRLEIFRLTKEVFEQYESDLQGFQPEQDGVTRLADAFETSTRHTFDEGYYYVRIFALSENENSTLSSHEFLQDIFAFSKELSIKSVGFGFDQDLLLGNVSGFYVKIDTDDENVKNFDIIINDETENFEKRTDGIYALSEKFLDAKEYEIKIVAHGKVDGKNDDRIYHVAQEMLKVVKLSQANFDDFEFDERTFAFDIQNGTGTKKVEAENLTEETIIPQYQEGFTHFELGDKTGIKFSFVRISASRQDDSKDFEIFEEDGEKTVYVDSEKSEIELRRLKNPTNLSYKNGKVTFSHENLGEEVADHYVLDLIFHTSSGKDMTMRLSLNHAGNANEVMLSTESVKNVVLQISVDNGALFESSGSEITFHISELFQKLPEQFKNIYDAALSVDFSAWAFQQQDLTAQENGYVLLSSANATTQELQDVLSVKKMEKTSLQFVTSQDGKHSLKWAPVASSDVQSETNYVLHQTSVKGDKIVFQSILDEDVDFSGTGFSLEGADFEIYTSTAFTYYVVATNSYRLDSSDSNHISIIKNDKISKIRLNADGTISFSVSSPNYCKEIEVKIDGKKSSDEKIVNGKLTITDGVSYSFQAIGKDPLETDNLTTYFLNGEISSWTFSTLESISKTAAIKFEGNIISWDYAFDVDSLAGLEYVLFFKDGENGVYSYFTTAQETDLKQVNLFQNSDLREKLGLLAEGSVQVQLSAHIKAHDVAEGETVYYGPEILLLSGNKEFNHHLYGNTATIKKLTAPKLDNVEFVGFDTSSSDNEGEWTKRQNPNIKITFSGNYGNEASFKVLLNYEDEVVEGLVFKKEAEGKYSFELTPDQYANAVQNGQTLYVKIYVLGGGTGSDISSLPSSPTTVQIVRASMVEDVQLLEDDCGIGYSRMAQVKIAENNKNQFVGNIVLKIECQPVAGEKQVKFISAKTMMDGQKITFSEETNKLVSDFIDQALEGGGTAKISAYADNFSSIDAENKKIFILSCTQSIESEEYFVLQHVVSKNISRVGVGFEIQNVENNSQDTIYVLEYRFENLTKTIQIKNVDGHFVFNAPPEWNVGQFDIFAVQSTKQGQKFVKSKKETINFSLSRLNQVGVVTLKRGTDQALSLEWDKVENASEYLLQVFARDDKKTLLCEAIVSGSSSKISCTLEELLGDKYSKLSIGLAEECEIYIEFTALGSGEYNNSLVSTKYATILGNPLSVEDGDIYVENGLAYVKVPSGRHLVYRFVYANTGSPMTEWADVPSNGILDTFGTVFENTLNNRFDIEIFVKADETSSDSADFVFDSQILTTQKNDDFTFEKLPKILNVSYSDSAEEILIEFVEAPLTERYVFVGTSKDELLKGEKGKVVKIALQNDGENSIFAVPLNEILIAFDNAEIDYSKISNIFFWEYRDNMDGTKYVASQPFDEFEFSIETEFSVQDVKRLKDVKQIDEQKANEYAEGWTNTFLTFLNSDGNLRDTRGINVKMVHTQTGKTFIRFVPKAELLNSNFDSNTYVVNLNKIFDDESVVSEQTKLVDLAGEFEVYVMKVGTNNGVYTVSKWVSVWNDKQLKFTKLAKIRAIELSQGNLYWNASEDVVDEYYVYFYDYVENSEPTSYQIVRTNLTKKDGSDKLVPQNFLDASSFAMEKHSYYLAVQSVDHDDLFVLASKVTFKMVDETETKMKVYKNQMDVALSPLVLLENGTLQIDWAKNDENEEDLENLINVLRLKTTNPKKYSDAEIATMLATNVFTSPFTFSLQDLLNGYVNLKLRFTPVGGKVENSQSFVVDGFDILSDLIDHCNKLSPNLDLIQLLTELDRLNLEDSTKKIIQTFASNVKAKRSGIGNSKNFMDDFFENLQAGKYSLEYCLLGNYHTLSSEWYSFKNSDGQNEIAINAAPKVQILRVPQSSSDDNMLNEYKVLIEKSQIETSEGSETAETYYVRIGVNSFIISKVLDKYQLKVADGSFDGSIDVYEANSDGSVSQNGQTNYLMFYLNLHENEGGSILSAFNELIPRDNTQQQFEICAVGKDNSLSSKSNLFRMTFLAFTNFAVNEGRFSWATPGMDTKVLVKQTENSNLIPILVRGGHATSNFTLGEEYGAGNYDHIQFMLVGEISKTNPNVLYIDSEICMVKNLYKLVKPSLTNNLGYIGINVGTENFNILKNIFSNDENHFVYQIQNNATISGADHINIKDSRSLQDCGKELSYSPGATGFSQDDERFEFKQNEKNASHFGVRVLGTTATLLPKETESYNVQELLCADGDKLVENDGDVKIALQSDISDGIEARMMGEVHDLAIRDGMLVWDEANTQTEEVLPENATVVYRVDIERYTVAADGTKNFIKKEDDIKPIYTTETYFDLSQIEKDSYDADDIFFRVTIRALALDLSETLGQTVTLQNGQLAGGNVQYESGRYVLLGEGISKDGITRLASIVDGSIEVSDRKITFRYVTKDSTLTAENFKNMLDFVVVDITDGDPVTVDGTFTVELQQEEGGIKQFLIVFEEENLSGGVREIIVYTTLCAGREEDVIRSFGVKGTVTKIAKITKEDFKIETDYVNQIETLSFENYFKENENNTITATFDDGTEIVFTKDKFKLYILRSIEDFEQIMIGEGYLPEPLIVGENESKTAVFVASEAENVLSSDESEEFLLNRSAWAEDSVIIWDEEKGEFSWDIKDESFEEFVVEATYAYVLEDGAQQETQRIYHTSQPTFKPTIIGRVSLSVRSKVNNNSLQSNALSHLSGEGVQTDDDGTEYVNFNLFSSGMGTEEHPYIIGGYVEGGDLPKNEIQFKNIVFRQTKTEEYLQNFVEIDSYGSRNVAEEAKYYFRIDSDINLGEIAGILFAGDFSGTIFGQNHKISYTSSQSIKLSSNVVIEPDNNVAEITTGQWQITYRYGASLFENLTHLAHIDGLLLDASFKAAHNVNGPVIVAGLSISNSGQISNVKVTKFESNFVSQDVSGNRSVMVCTGLVGVNLQSSSSSIIENCENQAPIEIDDNGRGQFIFVSGIAYTNYASIKDCIAGKSGQQIKVHSTSNISFVQMAGIAITNSTGGVISQCTNNFDLIVEGPTTNFITCYLSGIVVLGKTMTEYLDSLTNNGNFVVYVGDNGRNIFKAKDGKVGVTSR